MTDSFADTRLGGLRNEGIKLKIKYFCRSPSGAPVTAGNTFGGEACPTAYFRGSTRRRFGENKTGRRPCGEVILIQCQNEFVASE